MNGSGKTTTLGKIAADLTGKGARVMIVAGDTFRAAAREQLKVWAERASADFESRRDGADAAGLAFDAYQKARAEGYDVVPDRHRRPAAEQVRPDGRTSQDRPAC